MTPKFYGRLAAADIEVMQRKVDALCQASALMAQLLKQGDDIEEKAAFEAMVTIGKNDPAGLRRIFLSHLIGVLGVKFRWGQNQIAEAIGVSRQLVNQWYWNGPGGEPDRRVRKPVRKPPVIVKRVKP